MHALVFRQWKHRAKGRDWYDFEWYARNQVPLNFSHLQMRIKEFNGLEVNRDQSIDMLKKHLATTDIRQVKADVMPFVRNPHDLGIWSNDYVLQLAGMVKYK